MMKKKKWIIPAVCIILLAAAALCWFLFGRNNASSSETAYVQSIASMNGGSTLSDRYAGVVESQQTADFKAASGRKIDAVLVQTGQNVAEGTPLFRYNVTDAQNKVAGCNLEIENYNNQIAVLSAGANTTENQLQIRQLQYQIQVQQQEIAGYQQEISNAEVRSTIAGVVKSVNETGIGSDGSEAPIVVVAETGEFRVKGKISEQTVGSFYAGMPVFIRSRINENQLWRGEVTTVASEPEQNNNEYYYGGGETSSKYPFFVSLEKTDGLMLGQHVYIEPDLGQNEKKEGLWLDQSFIAYDESGAPYVWCGTSGKLKKQPVTLGETDEETWQVKIDSGLSDSDLIAWPDETFHEGMKAVNSAEGE